MKELTSYYLNKDVLFKELNEVAVKELKSRKKIKIYDGLSVDKYYYALFIFNSKSRFVRKSAFELMELLSKLISLKEHNYKKKELLISSALCSKAKQLLKENGWSVRIDFM